MITDPILTIDDGTGAIGAAEVSRRAASIGSGRRTHSVNAMMIATTTPRIIVTSLYVSCFFTIQSFANGVPFIKSANL
jgi:hypothetical protein